MKKITLLLRQSKTDLIIALCIAGAGIVFLLINQSQTVVDVQVYDTYYVLDAITVVLLVTTPLLLFIFLVRSLMTRFRAISANVGLIVGLALAAWIAYYGVALDQSFVEQIIDAKEFDGLAQDQRLDKANARLWRSWACFGGLVLCALNLSVRTGILINRNLSSKGSYGGNL
jgi:hypothetical protein